ncbi:hypothetical protein AB4Z54_54335, partial [Streptomyces sp. MCAF7]
QPGGGRFGYHFLSVVLASEDGTHQISLENRARRSARADRRRAAIGANLNSLGPDKLRETAAELRQEIERQEAAGIDEHLAEVRDYRDLTLALIGAEQAQEAVRAAPEGSEERARAELALEVAINRAAFWLGKVEPVIPGERQWYMRMYAQRPGESVHDVYAGLLSEAPSRMVNPITGVVLRGHETDPVPITFASGVTEAPADAANI